MDAEDNEPNSKPDELNVEVEEHGTEDENKEDADLKKSGQRNRILRLPLARIKNMMKLDPDCTIISQDSLFLITKATEMFIEFMAEEASKQLSHGKRKTVLKRDVDIVIENNPSLCFLDGALE
ncbi:DNA polymerase epsilon subunit 4 [Diabrotica virgifera virgifera]|uniref:DNA polymerase epsilon subunit 4 n=1 Tax=Diabrotica virgifera virgifera TaxID=50390 RepID=A0A6P7FJM1_DIAVI|nr:DNA polymerase epsilon subunit 4 [Diabrotica virgifera virgifera]